MSIPADRTFADVDPVPIALAWLTSHARVLEAFGGPEHVSGLREAPFPHLTVTTGTDGSMGSAIDPLTGDLAFEVWGDPAGALGPHALRRLSIIVCEAMRELPYAEYVEGEPVVSVVSIPRFPSKADQTNGQRRWNFTISLTMTPATSLEPLP